MRGAQATALGFAVRFAARLLFLFVAGRLYGARRFGVYVLGDGDGRACGRGGGAEHEEDPLPLARSARRRPAGRRPMPCSTPPCWSPSPRSCSSRRSCSPPCSCRARCCLPKPASALLLLAPIIAGQALLDLLPRRGALEAQGPLRSDRPQPGRALCARRRRDRRFLPRPRRLRPAARLLVRDARGARSMRSGGAAASFGGFGLARYRPSGASLRWLAKAAGGATPRTTCSARSTSGSISIWSGILLGRGPDRHLRHGAAGDDPDPPGPAELRRPAHPRRRPDHRRARRRRHRRGAGHARRA